MITIRLFCATGMSTSLLVNKMKDVARKRGIGVDIEALSEDQMDESLDGVDVALLGPQVGYSLEASKELCSQKGIPVDVIPMEDYGMMNGEKVLEFALKLAGK